MQSGQGHKNGLFGSNRAAPLMSTRINVRVEQFFSACRGKLLVAFHTGLDAAKPTEYDYKVFERFQGECTLLSEFTTVRRSQCKVVAAFVRALCEDLGQACRQTRCVPPV